MLLQPLQEQSSPLLPLDLEVDSHVEEQGKTFARPRTSWKLLRFSILIVIIASLAMGFIVGNVTKDHAFFNDRSPHRPTSGLCQNVLVRREWRSLSNRGKQHYIDAVQCTRRKPSLLGLNQSLYDDLPYVHMTSGEPGMLNILSQYHGVADTDLSSQFMMPLRS